MSKNQRFIPSVRVILVFECPSPTFQYQRGSFLILENLTGPRGQSVANVEVNVLMRHKIFRILNLTW